MFLGSKEPFPEKLRERMIKLEQNSAGYDSMTIMFAMNYGGRDDIVYAARRLAEAAADGDIKPSDIDEKLFRECFTQVQHPMPTLSYAPAAS